MIQIFNFYLKLTLTLMPFCIHIVGHFVNLVAELLRLRLSQLEAELKEKTESYNRELTNLANENTGLMGKIETNG